MSALAEALEAAQRRALAALQKQYVAGMIADDAMRDQLDSIGCADKADQAALLDALNIIRATGSTVTAEPKPSQNGPDRSRATTAQLDLMRKIAKERNYTMPDDETVLSRDHASEIIDKMKAGEYEYNEWRVPI